ncbi:MAG: crossover junction endodeoxyribonuclease RuvC [Thermoguttaceae bacterium]|nr:crossover junction endodeoxyribonuclease RuvC [Thermoguttaceae bacterium]MDW8079826.1 crossover junction endodeoxyribonuclease RuvC [Thermoguttaceae bacterium]
MDPDANVVRILGLDPGLRVTGYAVIEGRTSGITLCEAGVIRLASKARLENRLKELFDSLCELINNWQPSVAALEELFAHALHPRTAVLMGHARGVICLACAQANLPIAHYSATQVKKMLTASGRAPKAQIQRVIARELGLDGIVEPPDVADAIALALCHYHTWRRQGLMGPLLGRHKRLQSLSNRA